MKKKISDLAKGDVIFGLEGGGVYVVQETPDQVSSPFEERALPEEVDVLSGRFSDTTFRMFSELFRTISFLELHKDYYYYEPARVDEAILIEFINRRWGTRRSEKSTLYVPSKAALTKAIAWHEDIQEVLNKINYKNYLLELFDDTDTALFDYHDGEALRDAYISYCETTYGKQ